MTDNRKRETPLFGRTTWPLAMRLGNVAELTADALGRAAVAIALLGVPLPLAEHFWPETAPDLASVRRTQ